MSERELDREVFDREGLVIDQERVLTYSQLSCPLDCRYCFVEDMNFNQKRDVAYLSPEQYELLKKLPDEIKLIMLGCDTEFFQSKKDALEVLERLSKFGRDISLITKLTLSRDFIRKLQQIGNKMKSNGNLLTFSESIPCFDTAELWEPRAPHPTRRIETLRAAKAADINTLVAVRPLLPSVSNEELERIIRSTKDISLGYYSGPLYLKSLDHPVLDKKTLGRLNVEEVHPHWMPEGNIFYKIEREGQMEVLKKIVERNGRKLYDGAAEAIKSLKRL